MTPERFTNLDEWSQALEPGPCKTALRELVEYVLQMITTEVQEKVLIGEELQKIYAERDEFRAKLVELATTLESERKLVAQLAEEGRRLAAQRDALRKRVAELEQRLDTVPCGWTEPVPDYPYKRVRAKSVRAV